MSAKNRIVAFIFGAIGMLSIYHACDTSKTFVIQDSELTIRLRWVPGLEVTTKRHAELGLLWAFAQLGAFLPKDCDETAMQWQDEMLKVNLMGMGFEEHTYPVWNTIIEKLKSSEEYLQTGAVDMGRFLMLTVGTASHYYQLVNTPETLNEFKAQYRFEGKALKLKESVVAHGDRMIYIAEASRVSEIAYIGAESNGGLAELIFKPTEFETIDMLPNGTTRYGIYGASGQRKNWANEAMTVAGKPSKCMWCHESKVNGLVIPNSVYTDDETLTETEFQALVELQMDWMKDYRDSLNTELNYKRWREHQKMERIYEHFMEPSLARLSAEWSMTEAEVAAILEGVTPHESRDFGEVYHRADVDHLGPFKVIRVPSSAREKSSYEPSFFPD